MSVMTLHISYRKISSNELSEKYFQISYQKYLPISLVVGKISGNSDIILCFVSKIFRLLSWTPKAEGSTTACRLNKVDSND